MEPFLIDDLPGRLLDRGTSEKTYLYAISPGQRAKSLIFHVHIYFSW